MTGSPLIPLDLPIHHAGPFLGGPPPFVHLIGGVMFLLFLLATAGVLFFLSRTGRIGPPPWAAVAAHRAPEAEAKKILADRFANGTISAEEFMERASVLNWVPGSESWTQQPTGKKRKR